ncbi:ABC transporter permease [Dictyoglomus thermophilum]|uniref:Transmembrane lipoprotein n=1 Tax=Dictyoglomus thermophilum (strain ATCC 35947 / DSM 3960 / H-6-12) TaxID=309799 RepID=B5YAV4_DICT6|nr:ABC transporter permease subunit [Dictyoglomus thermophilum]ACI18781.1 transmembrane lipoprotein [Dictyoglomus thermophilum H-6-12]
MKFAQVLKIIRRQKYLILMIFPFVVWLIIFRYIPLWGWITAFQNYKPGIPIFQQQWVGLKYFKEMFSDPEFYLVMRNTLAMSLLGLIFGFPLPIILAILINEIRHNTFKRTVQTISYLPHFVSWVIVASIVHAMLAPDGVVNYALLKLGLIKQPILFFGEPKYFWWIVVFSDIWKELGWNTIIFLAAMTAINPELYEAAEVDGASRFRKIWHITLPGIMPTVIMILILSIGNIINIGFERQFLLRTSAVRNVSDVIDLYALDYGIRAGRFSFGTAAGIFKSVISLILLFSANKVSKKVTGHKII